MMRHFDGQLGAPPWRPCFWVLFIITVLYSFASPPLVNADFREATAWSVRPRLDASDTGRTAPLGRSRRRCGVRHRRAAGPERSCAATPTRGERGTAMRPRLLLGLALAVLTVAAGLLG